MQVHVWHRTETRAVNNFVVQVKGFDILQTRAYLNISFLIKWKRHSAIWQIQLNLENLSFIDCLLHEKGTVVAKETKCNGAVKLA